MSLTGLTSVSNIQSIIGGSGDNTISGGSNNDAWTINGSNAGSVTDGATTTAFSSFGNIIGGTKGDDFNFTGNGSLSGGFDRGLECQLSASPRLRRLQRRHQRFLTAGSANGFSGTGTGIGAGFTRITSLTGSSNNDALTGTNNDTIWTILQQRKRYLLTGGNTLFVYLD